MQTIEKVENQFKKIQVVDVRSGDTVRVHQKIKEGNKERVQIFQGLVIRVDRRDSHTARLTVRKVSSGIGVEKSFLLNSPSILKIEITKRSKVRRNYLSYMRSLTGRATRLSGVEFNREEVNKVNDSAAEAEAEKLAEQTSEEHAQAEQQKNSQTEKDDKTDNKTEPKEDDPPAQTQVVK
jgi:large subunit ribosomal protein L19